MWCGVGDLERVDGGDGLGKVIVDVRVDDWGIGVFVVIAMVFGKM